jgi:hypothetical protein
MKTQATPILIQPTLYVIKHLAGIWTLALLPCLAALQRLGRVPGVMPCSSWQDSLTGSLLSSQASMKRSAEMEWRKNGESGAPISKYLSPRPSSSMAEWRLIALLDMNIILHSEGSFEVWTSHPSGKALDAGFQGPVEAGGDNDHDPVPPIGASEAE